MRVTLPYVNSSAIWAYIERFSSHLGLARPDTLYHHARATDALAALQQGELWASALPYWRGSEAKRSLGVALHLVEQRLKELALPPTWDAALQISLSRSPALRQTLFEHQLFARIETLLKAHLDSSRLSCALSLASSADNPALWRRHCPAGGYALGFSARPLARLAEEQGFSLFPCYYGDWAEHDEIIQGALLGSSQAWLPKLEVVYAGADLRNKTGRETAWYEAQTVIRQEAAGVCGVILQVAALLRHEAHEAEGEWRLITGELRPQQADYRETGGVIAPFKRFDLGGEPTVSRVVVATQGERSLALHGLKGLLSKVSPAAQQPVQLESSRWHTLA